MLGFNLFYKSIKYTDYPQLVKKRKSWSFMQIIREY